MTYDVILTLDAMADLESIHDYIFNHDSPSKAEYVVIEIEKAFSKLSSFPERGSYPKELLEVGIQEYREIHFKPYRIIHRIENKTVFIYVIIDARRNLQEVLLQRLLACPP